MKKKLSVLVWTLVRKIFGNTNRFRTVVYCATVAIAVCTGCNDGMGTALRDSEERLVKEKYTITFDANGGIVTPTSGKTDANGKIASLPSPTMAGYMFNGWFTTAVGGTVVTTSYVFSAVTTIYAQWMENNNCTSAGACKSKLMPDGKVWMTENLNVETSSGSRCYNDSVFYCNKYGRLYDWQTAKSVCPSGWHLPKSDEWDRLAESVGGQQTSAPGNYHIWSYAGTKLKSTSGWYDVHGDSSGNGTDDFGFSALPGGHYRGGFRDAGFSGYWWMAPEYGGYTSSYRNMDATSESLSEIWTSNVNASSFSVRCVSDAEAIRTDSVGGNYTLSINTNPIGGGTVSRSPNKTFYTAGEQVTVAAATATGYKFVDWSGVSTSTDANIVVTMNNHLMLTANFAQETIPHSGEKFRSKIMPDGKTWMTENLNIETTDSWCYGNDPVNCVKYGRLYTWTAAKTACLLVGGSGWHLPSREEWGDLAIAAGGTGTYGTGGVAGIKLKDSTGWNTYSGTRGTNDFGFSALPGGTHASFGMFYPVGNYGAWWTATEDDRGGRYEAYHRYMIYNYDNVDEGTNGGDGVGFSVRCIEDTGTDPISDNYTLSINTNSIGGGTVSRSPNKIFYTDGEKVTVTVATVAGYKFVAWSGVSTSTDASIVVIMSRDLSLTAIFAQESGGTFRSKVMPDGKIWMTEDLNIDTMNSWCYNDDISYCNRYGRLYDLETATTVCPSGWHLPSEAEWNTLIRAAGGASVAGKKLRSTSWYNGTDDFGFSALPGGGYCGSSGNSAGSYGTWWTATAHMGGAIAKNMGYSYDESVGSSSGSKYCKYSVRCVSD